MRRNRSAGTDDAAEIAPRLESALFQISRDALDNVARHSGAQSAVVELGIGGGAVRLSIRDDGGTRVSVRVRG